ncbi:MAG: FHA domain-containing protein [Gammaproteobacteria bacterium]
MSTAKLIISLDEKIVDEVPIEKEIISIGRKTDNDLCLDNLSISGYHSQISSVLDDCFVEDLNSTNGTFVNSKIIKKHALKDGDIIDVGNHRIKYVNHLASSSANSEFEKTLIMTARSKRKNAIKEEQYLQDIDDQINSLEEAMCVAEDEENAFTEVSEILDENNNYYYNSSIDETIDKNPEQAIPTNPTEDKPISDDTDTDDIQINSQPASSSIGRIQILNGKNSGKEIALDKSLTTVGKPDVAVVGITKRNTGYFIMHIDGNQKTPSKLNGVIIGAKAQPIEAHDIIDVAGIKLEFFVE